METGRQRRAYRSYVERYRAQAGRERPSRSRSARSHTSEKFNSIKMKIDLQLVLFACTLLTKYRESWAFSNKASASFRHDKILRLSLSIEGRGAEILRRRDEVLELAQKVFHESPTGVFITDPGDRSNLKKAVTRLEATTDPPTNLEKLLGCWKLICTTNTAGFPTLRKDFLSGTPFSSPSPLKENIQKNAIVYQKIWNERNTTGEVFDRIDNIIDITADGWIAPFLNPLDVTKTKFTLIHKVESNAYPVIRTKISLQKVVVTVAGKSRYLDANGADVFGIKIPLGDLLNSGSFETTYVDESIRVSRGTIPFFDELRVFIKVQEDGIQRESSNITSPTKDVTVGNETYHDTLSNKIHSVITPVVNKNSDSTSKVEDTVDNPNRTVTDDTASG